MSQAIVRALDFNQAHEPSALIQTHARGLTRIPSRHASRYATVNLHFSQLVSRTFLISGRLMKGSTVMPKARRTC
jgi:hypothetical protein